VVFPLALLSVLASAAEPDAVAPDAATEAPPATEEAPETTPEAPAVLERTFAMRQVFTSEMRDPNPFSSTGWRSTHTHTWAVVTWKQTGDAIAYQERTIAYQERTCGIETDKVFGASTTYPPAFITAVPLRERTAKLAGSEAGARFKAGPYVQSFGVKLDDPYDDPLPTDPKDPRLVDTDKDGNPGVTVKIAHPLVGKGEVWVAQRSVARLEGELQADGSIVGVVYTAPDMFKIGANRWWLRADSPQRQHPDPKMSPFVLIPADQGLTCEALLAKRDSLFPPAFGSP
jgi:hypothetical protein